MSSLLHKFSILPHLSTYLNRDLLVVSRNGYSYLLLHYEVRAFVLSLLNVIIKLIYSNMYVSIYITGKLTLVKFNIIFRFTNDVYFVAFEF